MIASYLTGLKGCLDEVSAQDICGVAEVIYQASGRGSNIYLFGNGGSASTATHFACDLAKAATLDGTPRVRASSLCDNLALLSALANDVGYEAVFREQLRLRLERSDVVLGISAAGNSPNVLAAMRYATARGAQTVALVGFGGGRLAGLVERALVVSSCDYGQVEDTHLALNHLITRLVVSRLVAEG